LAPKAADKKNVLEASFFKQLIMPSSKPEKATLVAKRAAMRGCVVRVEWGVTNKCSALQGNCRGHIKMAQSSGLRDA
jgi:hypothetical protein